jgi:hypothetical protein
MTLDFLLTAIMARSLVLGGGFLLGSASASGGGQDTLAFLLCLALCATLDKTDDDAPVRGEADSPSHLARWLILAGLFASFSRPALGAAAGIILLLDSAPFRERLALACSFALAVWISMVLPLPHLMGSGREELSLGWYFSATLEALGQTPQAPFLGLPLGDPLALAITEDLPGLEWDPEAMGLPVYIFEIPSSGLRLLAAWGAGGPIVLLAGVLLCALRGRSRFGFGLVLLTLVCGALTPVLHAPATAVGLCLTLLAAASGVPSKGGAAGPSQGDA